MRQSPTKTPEKGRGPQLVEGRIKRGEQAIDREFDRSKALKIGALVCILIVASWVFLALFEPGLDYRFSGPTAYPIESREFLRELEALTDARVSPNTAIEPLPNGENYYAAELNAIRGARRSIDLEAYIFHKGEVAQLFVDALTQRAKQGVQVRLVADAVGSFSTPKKYFKELEQAGGKVAFYHPLRWTTIFRSNNRTHRELLIVDGETAFIGGSGIADHWLLSKKDHPRWRDNMYRLHGDAVAGLQGTFVENWLESSGEIITGPAFFPFTASTGTTPALVIGSSPSGRSTRARILMQTLTASAKESIVVVTPYFLPDKSMQSELIHARDRGVQVRILVPGDKSDHSMTRSSSRSKYGPLLLSGAEIYEYAPAMIHQKLMIVDGTWVVIGSTNMDSRSFGLNDEINLAARDTALAESLTRDFQNDIVQSKRVTYDEWKKRPVWERVQEWFGWLIERQQ